MKTAEKKKLMVVLLTALCVVLLDQLSKFLVVKEIIPLNYIANTGAGFGILKGYTIFLIWIAIIIIGFIFYYFDKIPKIKYVQYAIGLLLGGALGNLIDRIFLGYVIDFINLRFWPSFNIADSAITVSVILLMIHVIKDK